MLRYYNVHLTKNRGKNSCFPEHHWVASLMIYAFHPTTFFQFGVSPTQWIVFFARSDWLLKLGIAKARWNLKVLSPGQAQWQVNTSLKTSGLRKQT